jgi:hypothetical protein
VEELATKTVSVYVAETKPKIKKKSIKPNRSLTIVIQDFSRTYQLLYLLENVHAKSHSVRKNIVSVLVLDLSVLKNVNALDVRMVNAIIMRMIKCIIKWVLQFMHESVLLDNLYFILLSLIFKTLQLSYFCKI